MGGTPKSKWNIGERGSVLECGGSAPPSNGMADSEHPMSVVREQESCSGKRSFMVTRSRSGYEGGAEPPHSSIEPGGFDCCSLVGRVEPYAPGGVAKKLYFGLARREKTDWNPRNRFATSVFRISFSQ